MRVCEDSMKKRLSTMFISYGRHVKFVLVIEPETIVSPLENKFTTNYVDRSITFALRPNVQLRIKIFTPHIIVLGVS